MIVVQNAIANELSKAASLTTGKPAQQMQEVAEQIMHNTKIMVSHPDPNETERALKQITGLIAKAQALSLEHLNRPLYKANRLTLGRRA